MQKSKGFVSAVMLVMSLAMVACASTRTTKSAGEQVDDSVTTGRVKAALIADPTRESARADRYPPTAASAAERALPVARPTEPRCPPPPWT